MNNKVLRLFQKINFNFLSNNSTNIRRAIHSTSPRCLKEIITTEEGNVTTVEARYIENKDPRPVLPDHKDGLCPLCPVKLGTDVAYTDVLILSQFVTSAGRLLPKRVTGLCPKAQDKLRILVHQAQRAGLMPELRPQLRPGQKNQGLMSGYKFYKYKTYFDKLTPMTITHSTRNMGKLKKRLS